MCEKRQPAERRFWKKVNKTDGCWLWTASKNWAGYGKFWTGEVLTASHRFSFELMHGPITNGRCVLHKCDNPACVRPDHLFLGTHADNIHDMMRKGRRGYTGLRGTKNHKAKLTENHVRSIRRHLEQGSRRSEIAKQLGVNWSTIDRIAKGERWKHVA
jgi:hypothetical protein